jgi:hypothetical protein
LKDKIAFIGDIHGDSARLLALLEKLDKRKLVFLGDYIDHGSNSREVVKLLLEIMSSGRDAVFLAGTKGPSRRRACLISHGVLHANNVRFGKRSDTSFGGGTLRQGILRLAGNTSLFRSK